MNFINLPGINGSGPAHWQSLWEITDPAMRRFQPSDWDRPDLHEWIAALDRAVADTPAPCILVAHSLACLLVAHWSQETRYRVRGAFLVSVPDPKSAAFQPAARGFADVPVEKLPFPTLIVASSDDPYGTLEYMRGRARQWDSELVLAGAFGHINAASGVGDWPFGRELLSAFASKCA